MLINLAIIICAPGSTAVIVDGPATFSRLIGGSHVWLNLNISWPRSGEVDDPGRFILTDTFLHGYIDEIDQKAGKTIRRIIHLTNVAIITGKLVGLS